MEMLFCNHLLTLPTSSALFTLQVTGKVDDQLPIHARQIRVSDRIEQQRIVYCVYSRVQCIEWQNSREQSTVCIVYIQQCIIYMQSRVQSTVFIVYVLQCIQNSVLYIYVRHLCYPTTVCYNMGQYCKFKNYIRLYWFESHLLNF